MWLLKFINMHPFGGTMSWKNELEKGRGRYDVGGRLGPSLETNFYPRIISKIIFPNSITLDKRDVELRSTPRSLNAVSYTHLTLPTNREV